MIFNDKDYRYCGGSLFERVLDESSPKEEPIYKRFLQMRFPDKIVGFEKTTVTIELSDGKTREDDEFLYLVFGEEI